MRFALPFALFGAACMSSGLLGCNSSSSGTGAAGTSGGCEDLQPVANDEFCAASSEAPDCDLVTAAYKHEFCGVALKDPPGALERSQFVEEFAGSGAPDLGCYAKSGYPSASGQSKTVTAKGIVKIFSSGCESKQVTIEAYTVKRTRGDDDGSPDKLIGTPVTTPSECESNGTPSDDPEKCGVRHECNYEYPGLPTETELMIKTYSTSAPALWVPIYEYNLYIYDDEVKDGVWKRDVRALAADDFTVIPQAAIGGPVTPGHGVIAGEVHDCGTSDNRSGVRLINAVVDVNVDKTVVTYFTDNEEHPLPDLSATGTSALGLYAAMDLAPGPVTVAAAGKVDGKLVSAGLFRARVFPDSVTSVTFRGLRPFQIPAAE